MCVARERRPPAALETLAAIRKGFQLCVVVGDESTRGWAMGVVLDAGMRVARDRLQREVDVVLAYEEWMSPRHTVRMGTCAVLLSALAMGLEDLALEPLLAKNVDAGSATLKWARACKRVRDQWLKTLGMGVATAATTRWGAYKRLASRRYATMTLTPLYQDGP